MLSAEQMIKVQPVSINWSSQQIRQQYNVYFIKEH